MRLKQVIEPNVFFDRLKKFECRFNKLCGLYPAKCNNTAYIGQLKDYKFMQVFELESDDEVALFKTAFKTFGKEAEIKIILENKK